MTDRTPTDGVPPRRAPSGRKVFGATVVGGSVVFIGAAVAAGLAGLWVAMMATVINGDEDGSALFHIPIILAFFVGRSTMHHWWQVRAGWSTLAPATLVRRVGLAIVLAVLALAVVATIVGGGWLAIDTGVARGAGIVALVAFAVLATVAWLAAGVHWVWVAGRDIKRDIRRARVRRAERKAAQR